MWSQLEPLLNPPLFWGQSGFSSASSFNIILLFKNLQRLPNAQRIKFHALHRDLATLPPLTPKATSWSDRSAFSWVHLLLMLYPLCLECLPHHLHVVNSFWKAQFKDHLFHVGSPTKRIFFTMCSHRSLPLSLCTYTSLRAETTFWSSGWNLFPHNTSLKCLAYGSCQEMLPPPQSHTILVLPSSNHLVPQTIPPSQLFPPGSQFMTQHFNFSDLGFPGPLSFSWQTLHPHLVLFQSLAPRDLDPICAPRPSQLSWSLLCEERVSCSSDSS